MNKTTGALVPFDDLQRMGKAIAESGLFGIKTPAQAIALALVAQAEGRHPASAAQDYHVINGRPSLKADAMLGRFLAAGGRVEWHELTDAIADATFHHDNGGSVRLTWDMDRAKAAGLLGNPTWKKYPRAMLRARLVSEGVRTVFPAVLGGMYTPEEVKQFDEPEAEETADAEFEIVDEEQAPPQKDTRGRILDHIKSRLDQAFGDVPIYMPPKASVLKDLFGSGRWENLVAADLAELVAATALDPTTDGDPERTRFERVIRLVDSGIRRPDEVDAANWPGTAPEPEPEPAIDAEVF